MGQFKQENAGTGSQPVFGVFGDFQKNVAFPVATIRWFDYNSHSYTLTRFTCVKDDTHETKLLRRCQQET